MFTFYFVEKMHPLAFEAIRAHRLRECRALSLKVLSQKRLGKTTHGELWLGDVMPQPLFTGLTNDGSDECMGLSTKCQQMCAGLVEIGGLIKPTIIAHKDLITTDHHSVRVAAGDTE